MAFGILGVFPAAKSSLPVSVQLNKAEIASTLEDTQADRVFAKFYIGDQWAFQIEPGQWGKALDNENSQKIAINLSLRAK